MNRSRSSTARDVNAQRIVNARRIAGPNDSSRTTPGPAGAHDDAPCEPPARVIDLPTRLLVPRASQRDAWRRLHRRWRTGWAALWQRLLSAWPWPAGPAPRTASAAGAAGADDADDAASAVATVGAARASLNAVGHRRPHLEQLWLPYFLVRFELRSADKTQRAHVLVCGGEGTAQVADETALRFAPSPETDDNGPPAPPPADAASHARPTSTRAPRVFPATLSASDAVSRARHTLEVALLSSVRWSRRWPDVQLLDVEAVGYPFWVYYFPRRGGMLDAALLDAVTGRRAGPKAKVALLAALLAARSAADAVGAPDVASRPSPGELHSAAAAAP